MQSFFWLTFGNLSSDLCVLANIIRPGKETGDVDGVERQEEDEGGRSQVEQPWIN